MIEAGHLIVISGVSGVGKNTILKALFKHEDLNLIYSVSMTTRTKRFNEVEGVNYFFRTNEEFDEAIEKGELLEWAEFCGNRYGTPKNFVEKQTELGNNVVLEIEVKGALNIMKMFPKALSIFLLPPSLDELHNRLIARGTESDDVIQNRIAEAKKELTFKDHYKHLVVNDEVDLAVKRIKKIIKNER